MTDQPPRRPRVFDVDDPRVAMTDPASLEEPAAAPKTVPRRERARERAGAPAQPHDAGDGPDSGSAAQSWLSTAAVERGVRWGLWFACAVLGLVLLSFVGWISTTASALLAREDWIGWLALALAGIALFSAAMLILGEIVGFLRLARLGSLRHEANELRTRPDRDRERRLIGRLLGLAARQPRQAWAVRTFRSHLGDVHDAGALLALAERDLLQPLDTAARGLILVSARRVATVTAVSPIAALSVLFVLYENLALMRRIAALYGGRPNLVGSIGLARRVIATLVASGGLALTDDLFGQFLGQDLLRRLSRRLAEGAVNGALTARLGATTVDVVRPLPFVVVPPVRARDVVGELLKRKREE
jgi:putative membrane protein